MTLRSINSPKRSEISLGIPSTMKACLDIDPEAVFAGWPRGIVNRDLIAATSAVHISGTLASSVIGNFVQRDYTVASVPAETSVAILSSCVRAGDP